MKVIEIMNDLDLGYNELPAATQTGAFRANIAPLLHPVLLTTGVTLIDIQDKTNLTIFSANGATIRHAELNLKRCTNLIIRNLKFDELWEWDESSKGDFDRNDWDLITVDMASTNIWIDHCDFGKAYDGVVDVKGGSNKVTISWCRFLQDSGATGSWLRRQLEALEVNRSSHAMYNFLRSNGFSVDDIVAISRSQKKGHLVGATEFASANSSLSVTLHHNLYLGMQDRVPRLRGGNAHVYNVHIDNLDAYAASLLYQQRLAAMPSTSAVKLTNGTYKFGVTQNASISTENGAVLVEKSYYDGVRYALRNNQADGSDSSYTGKIRAVDVRFKFGATDFRGGTDTSDHPLGPTQAPVIPFAFNGFTTLPYSYSPETDADKVPNVVSTGAGAGRMTWDKSNWLKTTYTGSPSGPAAPSIVTPPASHDVAMGDAVNFAVGASGTPPLGFQWKKGGTSIPGATSSTLTLANVQSGDAGSYSITVTNAQGSASSSSATLTVAVSATFGGWQQEQFTAQELADPGISGPNAVLTADGVTNRTKYALGIDAFSPAAPALPRMDTDALGRPVLIYRKVAGAADVSYVVRASTGLSNWSTANITHRRIAEADANGVEQWEARYTGPEETAAFFRLELE